MATGDTSIGIIAEFIDKASAGISNLQSKLGGLAQTINAAFAIEAITRAVTAISELTAAAIDSADAMGKAAQKFGVSTESLSALGYAAEMSDVSFEQLTTGFTQLTKAMLEAGDPASKAAEAFQALGVSTKNADGSLRKVDDVFGDLAQTFKESADGPEKTAVALELFGKAGTQLIPLLNEGKEGLAAFKNEAEQLGIVISDDTAKRADAFNDTIDRMKAASRGVFLQLAEKVLPTLEKLAETFVESSKEGGFLNGVVTVLATTFKALVTVGYIVGNVFQKVGKTVGGLAAAFIQLIHGDFSDAGDTLRELGTDLNDLDIQTAKNIAGVWKETEAQTANTAAVDEASKKTIQYTGLKSKQAAEQEKAAAAAEKERIALANQINAYADPGFEAYRKSVELITKAREQGIITQEKANELEVKASETWYQTTDDYKNGQKVIEERTRLTKESLTPLETLTEKLKEYRAALDAGTISQTVFDKLESGINKQIADLPKAESELTKFATRAAENIQDILGDAVYNFLQGKFTDIGTAFRQMLDKMVAQLIASKIASFLFGDFGTTGKIGGLAGSLWGGITGRAEGGPVTAGQPYIVGERRPELFVPKQNGYIYNNMADVPAMSGVTNHFTINAVDSKSFLNLVNQNGRALASIITRDMNKYGGR